MPSQSKAVSRHRAARLGFFWLALTAAVAVGGCYEEYFDRRDAITLEVGDAKEVNKATQTINRWPRHSNYDRWSSDGERARIATERYRTRQLDDLSPTGGATQGGATPQATGNQ